MRTKTIFVSNTYHFWCACCRQWFRFAFVVVSWTRSYSDVSAVSPVLFIIYLNYVRPWCVTYLCDYARKPSFAHHNEDRITDREIVSMLRRFVILFLHVTDFSGELVLRIGIQIYFVETQMSGQSRSKLSVLPQLSWRYGHVLDRM